MRAASSGLIAFLNAARANPDAPIAFADCFTFTLMTGIVLRYANVDYPIVYGGNAFSASGPMVQGLKYKCSVGLEVDRQQIVVMARPTDLVAGAAFLALVRDGALDGASVQRDRVFLTAPGGSVVDGVMLFHGRVSTVDAVGRTSATINVASDLVVLDYDMPQNLYSATCLHTLYDAGCGLSASSFATSATAASGSTATTILFSGASAAHVQGKLIFSTGVDVGIGATVRAATPGASLTLMYPLPAAPAIGDAFAVYQGCDHTQATCKAKFDNLVHFRGFPYVPPPQIAY